MRRGIIIGLAGLLILIFALIMLRGGPGAEPGPKLADFFPLTQGSSWDYLGEGNEFAALTREVLFTQGNRAQIREDTGGTVSALIFEVTEDVVRRIYNQPEFYDRVSLLDQPANDNTIILQRPLEVGNRWGSPVEREIVATNASVETPAGRFENCIKIQLTFENSILFEYYRQGVGLVKREFIAGDDRITSTLKTYQIK
ncbi:MAG: hypothetical protein KGZ79_05990 [Dethiobacter sp.]|jgi:hypothetical protein|nr:hypothetical protein [Dethiobacter sp.]